MGTDVPSRVIAEIASVKRIPVDRITIDSTFEELAIDSLDATSLLFALEEEFKISISDADARVIRDVRGAVSGVEKLLVQKTAGETPHAG